MVFDTASNANRIIGCVNAPSLQQKVIGRCVDVQVGSGVLRQEQDCAV